MAEADLEPTASPPAAAKPTPVLTRFVAVALIVLLVGYIGMQARTLWGEWRDLRVELTRARNTTVVGYKDINPNPSYAACPGDWIRDEGESTLLWSGWKPGVGHGWFRVGRGELDAAHISGPIGRDVIQAIDHPVVEIGGGSRWGVIPWDTPVAGLMLDGVPCVYPLLVMRNVEVVNDVVHDRPILVIFRPFVPDDKAVMVYEPVVKGERLTMGSSGYLHDKKPLLYDRKTESLWVEQNSELTAIAGAMKGTRMARIAQPVLVNWADWRTQHPQSRLIVGADRSGGLPTQ